MLCPICHKKTSRFSKHLLAHGHRSLEEAYVEIYLPSGPPECLCGKCEEKTTFISWHKGFRKYCKGHNKNHEQSLLRGNNNLKLKRKSWSKGLSAACNQSLHAASLSLRKTLESKKRELRQQKLNSLDIELCKEKILQYASNFELIENSYDTAGNIVFVLKCQNCENIQRENIFMALSNICTVCDPAGAKSHIEIYRHTRSIDADTVISCDSIIPPDDVDMFMPSAMLAIDYNRLYFHSDLFKHRLHHAEKSRRAQSIGIQLLHVFEDEWRDKKGACKNHIRMLSAGRGDLDVSDIHYASLDRRTKAGIFNEHHIEGDTESAYNVAAMRGKDILAVISLRHPRHTSYSGMLEIARYCCLVETDAIELLALLVKHAAEKFSNRIFAVIDSRLGMNSIYAAAGFEKKKTLEPKFWWTDGYQRLARHKLDKSIADASIVKIWGGDRSVFEYKKGAASAAPVKEINSP